ncbi:MAG: helix-turn-helix domain-containing protein [Xanthomonadales bacterium]|nr:helix-turn-helix domain-containing protein [Xanthomonadales bacterium]
MKRQESEFANPSVAATGQHLGALVRQARIARKWTMAELAERARVSLATLKRIEGGSLSTSMGAWLAVLERVGLMSRVAELRDPASEALLNETRAKRVRGKSAISDLDF